MKFYSGKILILGAETFLCKTLITRFKIIGYDVFLASDSKKGLASLKKRQPNLVVFDKLSSQTSSYGLQHKLHKISKIPIIKLTPKELSNQTIKSKLHLNYYLLKPFSLKRIETISNSIVSSLYLTKSPTLKKEKLFYLNNLIVDLTKEQVSKKGVKLKLTAIEFSLLKLLVNNIGKSLSRSVILVNIWGYIPERDVDTRLIDVHISRLRSKIEETPSKPNLIKTVRGIGYMLNPSKI